MASQRGVGDEPGRAGGRRWSAWAAAPAPGGGDRGGVRRRRPVLPGGRQGAGQVRDAARACARRRVGDRGGRVAWLLARRLLPGAGVVLRAGDGRAVGRAARPARAVAADRRDRGVPASGAARDLGRCSSRARSSTVRGEPASPHGGARAAGEPELLAGGRGGAGRLRAAARPGAGRGARARRGRAAVRALRAVGADRLAAGRAGVRGERRRRRSARRGRPTRTRASSRSATGSRSSWPPRPPTLREEQTG